MWGCDVSPFLKKEDFLRIAQANFDRGTETMMVLLCVHS